MSDRRKTGIFAHFLLLLSIANNVSLLRVQRSKCSSYLPTTSRRPCDQSLEWESECVASGCCWDSYPRIPNLRCYRPNPTLQMSFHATPRTPLRGLQFQPNTERLLFGGEPGYPGSSVIRRCSASRSVKPCGSRYKTSWHDCARFGCCWKGQYCVQPVYNVIRLRNRCPPGFKNPPRCEDVDNCLPNPCYNGASCTDKINGFECDCPPESYGPTCSGGCSAPPSISFGYHTPNQSYAYAEGSTIEYHCDYGYVISGFPINLCLPDRKWALTVDMLPSCDKDHDPILDILIILDSTDALDDCLNKVPYLSPDRPPYLPGPTLNLENFPNFFQQQAFVTGFENVWNTVDAHKTRVALHLNAGVCNATTGENFFPVRSFLDLNLNTATQLGHVPYICAPSGNFDSVLECAANYHFTASAGDREFDVPNVIIMIIPDVTFISYQDEMNLVTRFQLLRITLGASLYTLTSLPPSSSYFDINLTFLFHLTCGPLALSCDQFLGSIYDDPTDIANRLRMSII